MGFVVIIFLQNLDHLIRKQNQGPEYYVIPHHRGPTQCQQSTKLSAMFKIIVQWDSGNKRYDFEVDTPKLAGELMTFKFAFVVLPG